MGVTRTNLRCTSNKKVMPYDYLVIGEDEKARCKDDTPSVQAEENRTVVTMRDKRK